jgi:hypothetical protein
VPDDLIDPVWRRPAGEYRRPRRVRSLVGGHTFHAVGCFAYPRPFADLHPGDEVTVELVPEPHNPHDATAVSLDVNRRRVGYLARSQAVVWHEYVRSLNATGLRVETPGQVVRLRYDLLDDVTQDLGLVLSLPWPSDHTMAYAMAHRGIEVDSPKWRCGVHHDRFDEENRTHLLGERAEIALEVTLRPGRDASYARGPQPCLEVVTTGGRLVAVIPSRDAGYGHLVDRVDQVCAVLYLKDLGDGVMTRLFIYGAPNDQPADSALARATDSDVG